MSGIVGSKESVAVKFKEDICTELCLKLWFESDWFFCKDSLESDCPERRS